MEGLLKNLEESEESKRRDIYSEIVGVCDKSNLWKLC